MVIGAGAAGIVAACRAAELGARVTLLEKTDRIGTKILISGGGKCNITHAGSMGSVLKPFRSNEAEFLRPSCFQFTNEQILDWLTSRGLNVYTRPDGRIFPVDQTAKDVVAIFTQILRERGVQVHLNEPVTAIRAENGLVTAVETERASYTPDAVIIATGGSSYPKSGTTGDGWSWAKSLGLKIVRVRAALAPIELKDPIPERAGVSLRDILLRARANGKVIAKWRGDIVFTHWGISGPCALGISREVAESIETHPTRLEIDFAPDATFEAVQGALHGFKAKYPTYRLLRALPVGVPQSLVPILLWSADIYPEDECQLISKKQLNILSESIKSWQLGEVSGVPLSKGEVVAGGVSLDEVDRETMKSKRCANFYLCGEVLDIAGPVGGYNLQAAFSTGYAAGTDSVKD